ncbi:MAG: UPF0489 family protein, partial [Chlamydiota bacterium]|nr:UPF0489 family protein [Chlamydiota bacterium]
SLGLPSMVSRDADLPVHRNSRAATRSRDNQALSAQAGKNDFGTFDVPRIEGDIQSSTLLSGGESREIVGLKQFYMMNTTSGRRIFVTDHHHHAARAWMRAYKDGLIGKGSSILHIDKHADDVTRVREFKGLLDIDQSGVEALDEMVLKRFGIESFIAPMVAMGLIDPKRWYFMEGLSGDVFSEELGWKALPQASQASPFQFDYGTKIHALDVLMEAGTFDIVDLDIDAFEPLYRRLIAQYELEWPSHSDAVMKARKEIIDIWVPRLIPVLARAKLLSIATSPDFIDQSFAIDIAQGVLNGLKEYDHEKPVFSMEGFDKLDDFKAGFMAREKEPAERAVVAVEKELWDAIPINSFEQVEAIVKSWPEPELPYHFLALLSLARFYNPRAIALWKLEQAFLKKTPQAGHALRMLLGLYKNDEIPNAEKLSIYKFVGNFNRRGGIPVELLNPDPLGLQELSSYRFRDGIHFEVYSGARSDRGLSRQDLDDIETVLDDTFDLPEYRQLILDAMREPDVILSYARNDEGRIIAFSIGLPSDNVLLRDIRTYSFRMSENRDVFYGIGTGVRSLYRGRGIPTQLIALSFLHTKDQGYGRREAHLNTASLSSFKRVLDSQEADVLIEPRDDKTEPYSVDLDQVDAKKLKEVFVKAFDRVSEHAVQGDLVTDQASQAGRMQGSSVDVIVLDLTVHQIAESILGKLEKPELLRAQRRIERIAALLEEMYPNLLYRAQASRRRAVVAEVVRMLPIEESPPAQAIPSPFELLIRKGVPPEIIEILDKTQGTAVFYATLDAIFSDPHMALYEDPDVQIFLLSLYAASFVRDHVSKAQQDALQAQIDMPFEEAFTARFGMPFSISALMSQYVILRTSGEDLSFFDPVSLRLEDPFISAGVDDLFFEVLDLGANVKRLQYINAILMERAHPDEQSMFQVLGIGPLYPLPAMQRDRRLQTVPGHLNDLERAA